MNGKIVGKISRYFKYIIIVAIVTAIIFAFVSYEKYKFVISSGPCEFRIYDDTLYEEDINMILSPDAMYLQSEDIRLDMEREADGDYGKRIKVEILYLVERKANNISVHTYGDIELSEEAKKYFYKKSDLENWLFIGERASEQYEAYGSFNLEGCLRDASYEDVIDLLHGSKVTVTLVDEMGKTKQLEYYIDKNDFEIAYGEEF